MREEGGPDGGWGVLIDERPWSHNGVDRAVGGDMIEAPSAAWRSVLDRSFLPILGDVRTRR